MGGRPKKRTYQYSETGKFMQEYESEQDVKNKYYDGAKYPVYVVNPEYHELPDGTFISHYKIGRNRLMKLVRIDKNPYCQKNKTHKPFSIYNLRGEKIATFASIYHASLFSGKPAHLLSSRLFFPKKRNGTHLLGEALHYKFD